MAVLIQEVSSSLVREYLSRKGLKRTIACMDEEHPRTGSSINNTSGLRQTLHLEGLYKHNKAQKTPLKTLLEIIVKHHIEGHNNDKVIQTTAAVTMTTPTTSANSGKQRVVNGTGMENGTRAFFHEEPTSSRIFPDGACPAKSMLMPDKERRSTPYHTGFSVDDSETFKEQQLVAFPPGSKSVARREPEKSAVTESALRNRTNRVRRGVMGEPIANCPQDSNKKRHARKGGLPHPLLGNEDMRNSRVLPLGAVKDHNSLGSDLSMAAFLKPRQQSWSTAERLESEEGFLRAGKVPKTRRAELSTKPNMDGQMTLDDVDFDEELQDLSNVSLQSRTAVPQHRYSSHPMDPDTSTALKELLLGSSSRFFSNEWTNQGFTFSETHDLRYGIVQKKGGPCGVLASIQACVLQKLLFEVPSGSNPGLWSLRPSNATRRQCLIVAAAGVLWRAGERKKATLAITSGRNNFVPTGYYKSEGLFEKITCFTVNNFKDLQQLLEEHIEQFELGAFGCLLLTISAILSREVEKVKEDMDVPTTTLIGAHGYCTQELVNLLLCGRAVSNVFDDDIELDSGSGSLTLLKGIKIHCDIGLLSLFEHHNICKVGVHLKTPRFPIWVVCSESHFSVLFGLQRELVSDQAAFQDFDLYYYDGLANQQEEIRLSVSVGSTTVSSQDFDPDLIPPLELCIRTKWKDAVVSWNDTEPIL